MNKSMKKENMFVDFSLHRNPRLSIMEQGVLEETKDAWFMYGSSYSF